MTINEIELYDVEAVDEILSHLSNGDANVIQEAISSLCGMIYYRDRMCYIVLKEGEYMVQIAYTVPTDPKIAEELLHMNVSKAHEQMAELIKTERRRALEIKVYGEDN